MLIASWARGGIGSFEGFFCVCSWGKSLVLGEPGDHLLSTGGEGL